MKTTAKNEWERDEGTEKSKKYDMLTVWSRFIHACISQHFAILHKLHAEHMKPWQHCVQNAHMEYVLAIGIASLDVCK